jgi:uncharacterized protein YihD (DUF1040 family)
LRTTYEKRSSEFILKERWTSTIKESKFLQHIEVFDNNVLVSDYTGQILNYLEPLSDRLKKRIIVGIRKDYSSDGRLKTIETYDDSGKLISVEKYSR